MAGTPLLFSTRTYGYMAKALLSCGAFEQGSVESKHFPDGELYQRILSPPRGRDVVLLGGTVNPEDTLELFDLGCALAKKGAHSLCLVIPYFGHSTMERAEKPLEVVTAKTRARLLSAIPPAAVGNRVVLLDLHVGGIAHYFEGNIHPSHLYAKPVILEAAREVGGDDFILACTDAGRAKWVESLANDLGVHAAFVFKRRLEDGGVEISGVSAAVEGKAVVIYDDMVRTGGSLLQAAEAYRAAGAARVAAVTTHGVLPGEALQRIQNSGLLECLWATDSHPRAVALANDFLKIRSVGGLLRDYLLKDLGS